MDFIAHPSRLSSSSSYSFGNFFERVKDFCNFAVSAIIGNVFSAIFTFFFALGEFYSFLSVSSAFFGSAYSLLCYVLFVHCLS